MLGLLTSLIPSLLNLGDKLIEDKDKKNEYAFKVLEMSQEMGMKLLDAKTYPWVDALVKLAYASEQIVKGLFRPLGSIACLIFVAYCEMNSIELSPAVQTVMVSIFPGWVYSRYKEKLGPPNL